MLPLNPMKPPFSYGFAMTYLWFSYGFPVDIPMDSHHLLLWHSASVAVSVASGPAACLYKALLPDRERLAELDVCSGHDTRKTMEKL